MSLPGKLLKCLFSLSLLSFIVISLVLPQVTSAQSYSDSLNDNVPYNDHTKTQSVLINLTSALICQLVGVDFVDPENGCLTIDPETRKLGYADNTGSSTELHGLLGFSTNLIGSMYQPPASGSEYVQYLAQNFGIGEKVYAQEDGGFDSLSSIQEIWVNFRNLAYFVFTIFFVLIGFLIMIRVKIDPRTVMSIQNQIPRIIITLILITFSYAIVGLAVDGMWALTYFGINVLTPASIDKEEIRDNLLIIDPDGDELDPGTRLIRQYGFSDATGEGGTTSVEDTLAQMQSSSRKLMAYADEYLTEQIAQNPNIRDSLPDQIHDSPNGAGLLLYSQKTITDLQKEGSKANMIEVVNQLYDTHRMVADNYEGEKAALKQMIESYGNDKSLRYYATIYLNSTPFVYVNNMLSNAGGIERADGIAGLSYSVGNTIGDVISRSVVSVLGLDTQDCSRIKFWTWADCLTGGIRVFIKYLIGMIGFLVVVIAILQALFRVWLTLIRALVYIIVFTAIGPIMMTFGLVPGSSFTFGRWFRAILAHLLIFPVTVFIFLFARILASTATLNNPNQEPFLPPLIANTNSFDNIGLLAAFGLILLAPEMLGFVRQAVGSKPGPVGDIIKSGFMAGYGPGTAPFRNLWKSQWSFDPGKGKVGGLGYYRNRYFPKAFVGTDHYLTKWISEVQGKGGHGNDHK